MKRILTSLILLAFTFTFAHAEEADFAKIDYRKIDDILETTVLNRPENAELKKMIEAQEKKSAEAQHKMQKSILSGEKVDLFSTAMLSTGSREESKQVDLMKKQLLLSTLKKLFGEKYKLILSESNYNSSVLLATVPIDDVTNLVEQALLEGMDKK